MKATERTASLDPYVPQVVITWDDVAPGTSWRQIEGTLLFVDISGFTSLSERLARKGRVGAEELTTVLNRVFASMLDVAFERGGTLLKFGGDALLLLFTTSDHVMQACAAATEMRSVLRQESNEKTSVGRINLKMSSGLHTGHVDFFLVGSSHRELIVSGPAASLTTDMEATADAGEIVVSAEVKAKLPAEFTGDAKGSGWLLRKRRINHPHNGRNNPKPRSVQELHDLVPRALREHLSTSDTDSEHRLATIGFIKFKGVDRLLANEGPERVARALDTLVSSVQQAVDDEGIAFLASDIDADGGKIIFAAGVPIGQHDDEGRALRAARTILDSEVPLEVKIGLNRGHVFSGDVGAGSRRTYTVMGDTVNTAARLMAAAGPGMLYSSPAPLSLSSTLFDTETLEPLRVKGKEVAINAYAVFEEIGVRPPDMKHELPFHGRDEELEMIVTIVTTCATSGRGGMMTITGDTGVGKSRLIAEVLDRCPGLATLLIQAEPNGTENPYWAFRDPLRRLLGIERGSRAEMEASLRSSLATRAPEVEWAIPLLGDVLHIMVEDTPETGAIDPRFRPDRTADAIVQLLENMHLGAFAALAEDGHWMDEASLGLLKRIGASSESRPWTVIVTARCDETNFEPLGHEIALRPLDADAIRAIAVEATAGAPLRTHELEAIVVRAGGNPLFLSEILSVVRETGSADQLPDSLNAVVSKEVDTLPPLARQLLRYSSILGTSFAKVVLNEYLADDDFRLDDATRQEVARFLEDDGDGRLRFRHTVLRDVAYEGLPYRRRRELHARAASVVERLAGNDPDAAAEFLSTHYSLSGEYEKAWRFARVAADKAKRAYANTEAAIQYQRAIDAARHLESIQSPEIVEVWTRLGEVNDLAGEFEKAREALSNALKATSGDGFLAADLYLRQADLWFASGRLSQAKRNITLGRKQLKDAREPESVRALARIDALEASLHVVSGAPSRALEAAKSAVEKASSTDEREALARAYGVIDGANFMLGREEPRRGDEAVRLLQDMGFHERSIGIINNMGAYAYWEGKWDEATERYRQGIEAAERSGNIVEAANTRMNLGEVLVGQRRYEEARPLLEEAERVFRSSNVPQALPFVTVYKARAALGLGKGEQAIPQLEDLVSAQLEEGQASGVPEAVTHLAEALVSCGRAEEALEWLARFESELPDIAQEIYSSLHRARGIALLSQQEHREGIDAIEKAIEAAVTDGDLYAEALAREVRIGALEHLGENPAAGEVARTNELLDQLGIRSAVGLGSISLLRDVPEIDLSEARTEGRLLSR